jgi:hypothetical protein
VDLVQRALGGLNERDGVAGVAAGLGEAADLGAQLLADRGPAASSAPRLMR